MNPITRMMKRYIKTPLKYALPLLFICSVALVSISGCTSTTSPTATPSATPSAAPTTTAAFDPLLVKLEAALKTEYPSMIVTQNPPDASHTTDYLSFAYGLPNGNTISVDVTNGTASGQADYFSVIASTNDLVSGQFVDTANATHFGQSAATSVLGSGMTVQDVNIAQTGSPYLSDEYMLYSGAQNAFIFTCIQTGPS